MKRAFVTALLVLAFAGRVARADEDPTHPSYRAVIDRAELEPASITGLRLRVYLSALAIGGQMLDLSDPKSIKLYIGQSERKYPYALGTYAATRTPLDVVILVQITSDFADALPMISDALDRELLGHLGDKVKVGIATFGDATSVPKLVPAKQLRGKVSLASDGSTADPALSDAIDRALIVLKKNDPDARKMIVVIGDGRDTAGDHDRVTRTGERAAKDGVRIHTIAYSPADLRRPLLVLGELSKRSLGTLRWPGQGRKPTIDSWTEAFSQLAGEIDKQYVLTFFAPADEELAGKKLHIVTVGRTETTSNEVKVPELAEAAASVASTTSARPSAAALVADRRRRDRRRDRRARPGRVRDDQAPGATHTRAEHAAGHASNARDAVDGAARAGEGSAGRARPAAERPADSGVDDHQRAARRRAHAAPPRLHDRQAARLGSADRGRLHVEPTRADRDGCQRQLSAVRPQLDQRHVRQHPAHQGRRARARCDDRNRRHRAAILGTISRSYAAHLG